MKKRIEDSSRPEGYYYGYDSGADCLADYESNIKSGRNSDLESVAGYACLWVFLAAVVVLSIVAAVYKW